MDSHRCWQRFPYPCHILRHASIMTFVRLSDIVDDQIARSGQVKSTFVGIDVLAVFAPPDCRVRMAFGRYALQDGRLSHGCLDRLWAETKLFSQNWKRRKKIIKPKPLSEINQYCLKKYGFLFSSTILFFHVISYEDIKKKKKNKTKNVIHPHDCNTKNFYHGRYHLATADTTLNLHACVVPSFAGA